MRLAMSRRADVEGDEPDEHNEGALPDAGPDREEEQAE
jgi:hypothetical protein